jgi:VWFA-related protein
MSEETAEDYAIERRDVLKATGAGALVSGPTIVGTAAAQSGGTLNVDVRQIDRPDFPDVQVFASVRDSNGNPLTGLTARNFTVQEDGVNQSIKSFTAPEGGGSKSDVSVSLVIDHSGSMSGTKLSKAKTAAKNFVDQFRDDDQGQVISFGSSITFNERWTKSVSALKSAITSISSAGSTHLWEATKTGVDQAAGRVGRSAVIALTDGKDRTSKTADYVIQAAKESNVPVYTIALGGDPNESALKRVANETGGTYHKAPSPSDLIGIYDRISQSIADEYEITYETTNTATNGTIRDVTVSASYGGDSGYDTGIYEAPCAPLPTAAFSMSPSTPVIDQETAFDASASSANGGQLVAYDWDFDNNGVTDASGETATHTYTSPGTYEARLTVEKTCGARDVEVKEFDVSKGNFELAITSVNDPITAGETLEVTASVTNISGEDQTNSVLLKDFDGNTVDGNAVQLYPDETTEKTLEWDTESGDKGTGEIIVSVGNVSATETVTIEESKQGERPTASFEYRADPDYDNELEEPEIGTKVTFDASKSKDQKGKIQSYEWDFDGDGTFERSTDKPTIKHGFSRISDRKVTLRVTDTNGNSTTASKTVPVHLNQYYQSLEVAQEIDSGTVLPVLEDFLDEHADIEGAYERAQERLNALESAVTDNILDQDTAQEATTRLALAESGSLHTVNRVGPSKAENDFTSYNIARLTARKAFKFSLTLLTIAASIVAGAAVSGGAVASFLVGGLVGIAGGAISSFLGDMMGNGPTKQDAVNKCHKEANGIVDKLKKGAFSTGEDLINAIDNAVDRLLDLYANGLRAVVDLDAADSIISGIGAVFPGSIYSLLGVGDSIYGSLETYHTKIKPDEVSGGLNGSSDAADKTLANYTDSIDSTLQTTTEFLENLSWAIGEVGIMESITDLFNNDEGTIQQLVTAFWTVVDMFHAGVSGALSGISATVGYAALAYLKTQQTNMVDAVLHGQRRDFPNV